MTICDGSCAPRCYGCTLRDKNVGITPSSMPTRMNSIPPAKHNPAWEKGIITDKRPDGSEMPILEPGTNTPLHVKHYYENKRQIDAGIKVNKAPALS